MPLRNNRIKENKSNIAISALFQAYLKSFKLLLTGNSIEVKIRFSMANKPKIKITPKKHHRIPFRDHFIIVMWQK